MLTDDYGPFSGPTTSFTPAAGPRVGDVQREISIYTKEFVIARVDEAINAALVVFYVLTGKNPGQYLQITNGIDLSKKMPQIFSGKLKAVERPSATKLLTSTDFIPEADKKAYSSAKALTLTIRHVLQLVSFISVYSNEIDRNAKPEPQDDVADLFVKLFTGDRELIRDLRYLCSIFFVDAAMETFTQKMFRTRLAVRLSRPDLGNDDEFRGFIKDVLLLKRVMSKILIHCQNYIPFLSVYGLEMNSAKDSRLGTKIRQITHVQLLSVRFNSRRDRISDSEWYTISRSPDFYRVCTRAAPNTCPLFRSAESFFAKKDEFTIDAFMSSLFMATAYVLAVAYAHERIDPAKASGVFSSATKALLPASKDDYQTAMGALSDVLATLYVRRPDVQKRFNKDDPSNNLLVTSADPVITRAVYTRELAALQYHRDPRKKASADRIIVVRRIICTAALLRRVLSNERETLAYGDIMKLSEHEVVNAAAPIYSGIKRFPIPLFLPLLLL